MSLSRIVDLGEKLLDAVRVVASYSCDPNDDQDYQDAFEAMQRALGDYDRHAPATPSAETPAQTFPIPQVCPHCAQNIDIEKVNGLVYVAHPDTRTCECRGIREQVCDECQGVSDDGPERDAAWEREQDAMERAGVGGLITREEFESRGDVEHAGSWHTIECGCGQVHEVRIEDGLLRARGRSTGSAPVDPFHTRLTLGQIASSCDHRGKPDGNNLCDTDRPNWCGPCVAYEALRKMTHAERSRDSQEGDE